MSKMTPGPWSTGCMMDDDKSCNCRYIFCEKYAGSVAEISIDNGKNIADGGNDCPPLEEARANARAISALPDLIEAAKSVLEAIDDPNTESLGSQYCVSALRSALSKGGQSNA